MRLLLRVWPLRFVVGERGEKIYIHNHHIHVSSRGATGSFFFFFPLVCLFVFPLPRLLEEEETDEAEVIARSRGGFRGNRGKRSVREPQLGERRVSRAVTPRRRHPLPSPQPSPSLSFLFTRYFFYTCVTSTNRDSKIKQHPVS